MKYNKSTDCFFCLCFSFSFNFNERIFRGWSIFHCCSPSVSILYCEWWSLRKPNGFPRQYYYLHFYTEQTTVKFNAVQAKRLWKWMRISHLCKVIGQKFVANKDFESIGTCKISNWNENLAFHERHNVNEQKCIRCKHVGEETERANIENNNNQRNECGVCVVLI